MGVLTILLERCENLADTDVIGKSDPYVTLTVKKDGWVGDDDVGQQKSSIKKNELNPVYDEQFTFKVPELKDHKLYMSVKDDEVGKDDKLGWCEIKLDEVDGLDGDWVSMSKVIDRNIIKKDGKIFIKMIYKKGTAVAF